MDSDDEIVNLLMRHVKNKNDYNDQELTYITAVLRHVLNQLDKQDESYKEKFIQNIQAGRDNGIQCFRLPRSLMIIDRQLNIAENMRTKHNNRFQSSQMQWLCVLLVRFFRFPQITHANDLAPTENCSWHYSKKSIDSICCNVYHFDLHSKFAYHSSVSSSDASVSYNNSNNQTVSFLDSSSRSTYENNPSGSSHQATTGAVTPQKKSNLVRMIQIDRDPRTTNPNEEVDLHLIPIRSLHDESEKRYSQTMNTSLSSSQNLDLESWATIQYHEGKEPKGRHHTCYNRDSTIIIDSGCNPVNTTQRFCVNSLENLSNDPETVELRHRLNKGLVLSKVSGTVFLDNNTNYSCFYQSWIGLEMINKKMDTSHHRATVMEVTSGLVGIPIFDIKIFAQDLEMVAVRYQRSIDQLDTDGQNMALEELNRMERRCIIRICLEGYGENYEEKFIKQTKAWFEIKMHKALLWLDIIKQKFMQEARSKNEDMRKARRLSAMDFK